MDLATLSASRRRPLIHLVQRLTARWRHQNRGVLSACEIFCNLDLFSKIFVLVSRSCVPPSLGDQVKSIRPSIAEPKLETGVEGTPEKVKILYNSTSFSTATNKRCRLIPGIKRRSQSSPVLVKTVGLLHLIEA